MKNTSTPTASKRLSFKLVLTITASISATGIQAYDLTFNTNLPPITVHGLASQGYLLSSDYNYLANDTKNGSFQFSELGLNVSMNPFPRTRIAVQGFDFDVGNVGQYDPFLDYALIEYTFSDEIGIRGGRIRRPGGIYNTIQDIDLARTFVLLPQGVYDARWRDWGTGLDGLDLFGSLSLGKAGSVSYEAYAGKVTMQENGGPSRTLAYDTGFNVDTMEDAPIFGYQLWYNPPLDGLRIGAELNYLDDWHMNGHVNSPILVSVPVPFPPGALPGYIHSTTMAANVLAQQYSIEYLWKEWTFQTEYSLFDVTGYYHYPIYIPAIPTTVNRAVHGESNPEAWYAAVSYRINKHVELGTYYSLWHDLTLGGHQNDAALTARVDLTDWWIFKIEGHWLEGTGLLYDAADNPHVNNNSGWFMLAVKTTVSF